MGDLYYGVFRHVRSSIKAEQVFCSIVTQMTFLPQFENDEKLKIVHRENYETSYHRNTAAGNLRRLLVGEVDELLLLMTVECLIEAREHDQKAESALRRIGLAGSEDEGWLNKARYWHELRKKHLKAARLALYNIVGPAIWKKGTELAE